MGRITKNSGRQYIASQLQPGGRRAGAGVWMDDYSEESGNPDYYKWGCRMPHDGVDPKDLNGPVIIVKEASDGN